MQPVRDETKRKHTEINHFFNQLYDQKEKFGTDKIRIYSYKYCLYKTAHRYYMNWKSIENIINGWGNKKSA